MREVFLLNPFPSTPTGREKTANTTGNYWLPSRSMWWLQWWQRWLNQWQRLQGHIVKLPPRPASGAGSSSMLRGASPPHPPPPSMKTKLWQKMFKQIHCVIFPLHYSASSPFFVARHWQPELVAWEPPCLRMTERAASRASLHKQFGAHLRWANNGSSAKILREKPKNRAFWNGLIGTAVEIFCFKKAKETSAAKFRLWRNRCEELVKSYQYIQRLCPLHV